MGHGLGLCQSASKNDDDEMMMVIKWCLSGCDHDDNCYDNGDVNVRPGLGRCQSASKNDDDELMMIIW